MNPPGKADNTKPKLIIVLGMHRSGTSLVTRAMQVFGVHLGTDFFPPNFANEKGYWEDTQFHIMNEEILAALGSSWDCLSPITDRDIETLHALGFQDRARAFFQEKMRDAPVVVIKNPRLMRLLPFWNDVLSKLDCEIEHVFVIRNPLSVARSLAMRNKLPATQSHLLWLTHVIPALRMKAAETFIFTDYDTLINSPRQELDRLAKHLCMQLDPGELDLFRSDILRAELRHSEFTLEDLRDKSDCPDAVREIFDHLSGVASDRWALDTERILAWATEVDRLAPTLQYIDQLNAELQRAPQPFSVRKLLFRALRAVLRWLPFLRVLPAGLRVRLARFLGS